MDYSFSFCENCFSAKELIAVLHERGTSIPSCPICHSENVRSLPTSNELLKRTFRAPIRLNYSEWQYNTHIGGENLSGLLFGKNRIMNLDSSADEGEFQCSFDTIENEWYPKDGSDISLGGGYWDGISLKGVRHTLDRRLKNILSEAFCRNYYELEDQVTELLNEIRPDVSISIKKGCSYFRARIGVSKRMKNVQTVIDPAFYYIPYTGQDIGAPPINKACEGRLNRDHVSILYLASDRETAMSEIRPNVGNLVSSAEFKLNKTIQVANFTEKDIRNYLSDSRLETLRLIISFDKIFNLPIPPEQKQYYLITQLFTDCIRRNGYGGVMFKSSIGSGINLACFTPSAFILHEGSEMVKEVQAVRFGFEERKTPLSGNIEDYEVDSETPFETLFEVLDRQN